jgi:protein gp37
VTLIEWTDETWNPVTGCDRVSPGCDNCYALTLAARLKAMGQPKYQADGNTRTSGPGFGLTLHPDALHIPLGWRRPRRVFVNSMSDLFHPGVPSHFIGSVWATMAKAEQHAFQVLTKRPQRMAAVLRSWADVPGGAYGGPIWRDYELRWNEARTWPLPNVWLGTSIENDRYAWRAEHLRNTPAVVRFLSLEPLLGPLPSLDLTGIDWVIVGGESGPGARPMHPDWARDIRDRCVAAGVPFFFKQWGTWAPMIPYLQNGGGCPITIVELPTDDGSRRGEMVRLGKKAAGRELDGRTWDQMPEAAA